MNKSFHLNKLNKLSSFEIFSIPKLRYAEINYKNNFSFSEKTHQKNRIITKETCRKVRPETGVGVCCSVNFLRFFNFTPGKTTHKRNYFQRLHLIKKFSLISCDRNEARNVNQFS